jgi:hypothetical protein
MVCISLFRYSHGRYTPTYFLWMYTQISNKGNRQTGKQASNTSKGILCSCYYVK